MIAEELRKRTEENDKKGFFRKRTRAVGCRYSRRFTEDVNG